jgi:hypothetical protein
VVIIFISGNKIAEAIIKLMADNRISVNQWKFGIPDHITNQNLAILTQAKNLADGINYQLERKGIDIPDDNVVASNEWQEMVDNNGKVFKHGYNY